MKHLTPQVTFEGLICIEKKKKYVYLQPILDLETRNILKICLKLVFHPHSFSSETQKLSLNAYCILPQNWKSFLNTKQAGKSVWRHGMG